MTEPLLNANKIRDVLGDISENTLRRYIAQGKIPPPDAVVGRKRLWLESTIEQVKREWTA